MSITVLNPGLLTTVQDQGRMGYQQFGVSVSGACDPHSAAMANIFVSNDPGMGVLECTLMGPQLRFECDEVIAITGGDLSPSLDGKPIPSYAAVEVKAGQTLRFGAPKSGCRAYIAVAGGFDLPLVMGSVSTNLKCALGGFQGRKLKTGDELPLNQSGAPFLPRQVSPPEDYPDCISLRVLLGPQDDAFTQKGIDTFLGCEYTVTDKADRMGIRLSGEIIESKNGVDILSDGIAAGSVQIPASGTPIIMMADRQTTGGYAKIATVISADLSRAAQARPGTRIRFVRVTEAEAIRLRRDAEKKRKQLEYELLYR